VVHHLSRGSIPSGRVAPVVLDRLLDPARSQHMIPADRSARSEVDCAGRMLTW
jgi:hypothetical protein